SSVTVRIIASSANGTSRRGFLYSPAAAGVFSKPAYANKSSSAASPSASGGGPPLGASDGQSTNQRPTATNSTSGTIFRTTRATACKSTNQRLTDTNSTSGTIFRTTSETATRAPWRTPSTLTHARSPMLAAMIAARGAPDAAAGHRNDSASAKPFASDAIDAI